MNRKGHSESQIGVSSQLILERVKGGDIYIYIYIYKSLIQWKKKNDAISTNIQEERKTINKTF